MAEPQPRLRIFNSATRVAIVSGVTSGLLGLGLTLHDVETGSAHRNTTQTETASDPAPQGLSYKTLMNILPEGPCLDAIYGDSAVSESKAAEACVRAQAKGKIALINYIESPSVDTNQLADSIELTLNTLTDGLIQNTVVVKEATPQEKEALTSGKEPGNCIKPSDLNTWGSVIADRNEPEQADFVIAISDSVPCEGGGVGISNPGRSRHADVMAGALDKPTLDSLTQIAVHEQLHNYGLGHSGSYMKNDAYIFNQMRAGEVFDLEAYLQGGTYDEYAEPGTVMGYADDTPVELLKLNPVQLEDLRKPKEILDDKYLSTLRPISHAPGVIDYKAASDGALMTILLAENIRLSKSASFNRIVIVPSMEQSKQNVWGADLVLANDQTNATVNLGQIGSEQECNTWDIRYKDVAFRVSFADNIMTAQLIS